MHEQRRHGAAAWWAELPPAAGSAVMATGIISVGLHLVGAEGLSPMGMTAVATLSVGTAAAVGRLHTPGQVLLWLAAAAWALTLVGLLRSVAPDRGGSPSERPAPADRRARR